jgi:pilus assembly protein CpaC
MLRPPALNIARFLPVLLLLAVPIRGAVQQQAVAAEGQILHILVNKSVVINTQAPVTRVMTGNPAAVETVATTPTQIVVTGKAPGTSSLIIWDSPDRSQILDVIVEPDLSALRTAIERTYPGQRITVETDGARIILSGPVSSQKVAEDLVKMAGLYSAQVVNSLNVDVPIVPRERQVMLAVKFAEVDRVKISELGLNIISTGALNTFGTIGTQQFAPPTLGGEGVGAGGGVFELTDLLNVFLFRPDINLAVTLKALEQRAILQILAEPNLMALSGQKASFLAGGEFPFPTVQGGQNAGAVTIQFRPFGVKLDFTGTIGADDVIRLHVVPEVSTLDFANSVSISGFVVPAISSRRTETEIELKDGQSFGIAGLLDSRARAQMNKIPGIGSIPILGRLFTSKSTNKSNTELIVIVTPHIVDPVKGVTGVPPAITYPMPFLDTSSYDKTIPGNKNAPTTPAPK